MEVGTPDGNNDILWRVKAKRKYGSARAPPDTIAPTRTTPRAHQLAQLSPMALVY